MSFASYGHEGLFPHHDIPKDEQVDPNEILKGDIEKVRSALVGATKTCVGGLQGLHELTGGKDIASTFKKAFASFVGE